MEPRDLLEEKDPRWRCDENQVAPLARICPDGVRTILKGVSQWGLKEIWLGQKIDNHDRWAHSQGVLAVTARWLETLYRDTGVEWHPWPLQDLKHGIYLAGMAALLHDFGHLPFAHLLAEVLESINWVPRRAGQAGMEGWVLRERFDEPIFGVKWSLLATAVGVTSTEDARNAVQDLILGRFGVPWIQAILNSAVDADKIDYLSRDSRFLEGAGWPITSRMLTKSDKWLDEFLSDQRVSHSGLLCLGGRSAIAAADLLRERIFLHDRFYLSPEIRVAERMAFEIIQQFLIRAVMSDEFRRGTPEIGRVAGYGERFQSEGVDPIEAKGRLVVDVMNPLSKEQGGGSMREFRILQRMLERLRDSAIDAGYLQLLEKCFGKLEELLPRPDEGEAQRAPISDIHKLAKSSLVREPLVFHREHHAVARDALRPLQHRYCREILIDIAKLPRVLAMPGRWRASPDPDARDGVDYGILVPKGPVSAWGPGSKAVVPLTDNAVRHLERPYCRVVVIAPSGGSSARVEYIWDRVRSVLLEAGVALQATNRAEVS